jgi:hypothetical protein
MSDSRVNVERRKARAAKILANITARRMYGVPLIPTGYNPNRDNAPRY